jgi:ubiquinone/menaquinone biosynthesis C-methylase UbiE
MAPVLNAANVRLVDTAIELLDPKPNDTVLDIGFGGGYSLRAVAARVTRGKVTGVDYSREMVRGASRMIQQRGLGDRVSARWGDVANLPFPRAAFHKVLTVNSLYYWPHPFASLEELSRVMKPRGRIAVAFRSPKSLRPLTRGWKDFRLYEPEEVAALMRRAGLDVLRVEHRDQSWVLDTVVVLGRYGSGHRNS